MCSIPRIARARKAPFILIAHCCRRSTARRQGHTRGLDQRAQARPRSGQNP